MYGLKLITNYNESGDTRRDTTEKIWANQFLAKPETIAVGGLGGGGGGGAR